MWLAYPIVLLIALAAFALGVVPLGIVGLLVLLAMIAFGLAARGSQARRSTDPGRAERGGPAEAMPSTSQAAYQPARDPSRTGTS